jgi:hypothetical protein
VNPHTKLIIGVVFAGMAAIFQPPIVNRTKPGSIQAASKTQDASCVEAVAAPSTSVQTNDQNCAWQFFATIINVTDKTAPDPEWTKWSDKCGAGLTNTNNICPAPPESLSQDTSINKADRLAMRIPVQVELAAEAASIDKTSVSAPQLASVLFNPAAKQYIQSNGLGIGQNLDRVLSSFDPSATSWKARQLPPPSPGDTKNHPVALKLIWEIVYDDKPLLHVYDAATGLQSAYIDNSPGVTAKLLGATGWPAYKLDDALTTCNPTSPPEPDFSEKEAPPVSPSCFYSIRIDLNRPEILRQLTGDKQQVINGPNFERRPARAILVGFHAMELTEEHPLWTWMTFYWTRQTNGHPDWLAKWQHFQVKTTTTDGTDESTIHSSGPVFNPYLEGQTARYGMNTNCLSCHNLAAYTPGNTAINLTRANLYTHQPDPRDASLAVVESKAYSSQYFNNALRTSFLWSIATNQLSPLQPQPTAVTTKPK